MLERKSTIQIGYELQPREEELFFEMLSNREAALLWTFDKIGQVLPEVAPPQKIRTIPYRA
jgi:hypothetical protein